MDFFSHLVVGILTSLVTLRTFPTEYVMLAGLMAIMPDSDILLTPIYIKTKGYYWTHRGGSHSYVVGMIVSVFVGLIFYTTYNGNFFYYWIVGFLFYGLHISLDLFTTSRIPIFYPLSKKEYRFCGERAVNPVLMLCSFLTILLFVYLNQSSAKWSVFNTLRIMFFYLYFGYFSYKLISRLWIQARLPNNHHYIPGMLPLVYFFYETHSTENQMEFRLIKKVQFFPYNKIILETYIKLDSREMEYFNKAQEESKDNRFFLKWNRLIPLIKNIDGNIIVLLHLAESYAHGTGFFLKINFDKESGEIIEKDQRFGYFLQK